MRDRSHTVDHEKFYIRRITPLNSKKCLLMSAADIFAGLAVFSRAEFDSYADALKKYKDEEQIDALIKELPLSNAKKEKLAILLALDLICKRKKLGVSLRSKRGLRTFNPRKPLNFWMYQPQTDEDRAPTRSKS